MPKTRTFASRVAASSALAILSIIALLPQACSGIGGLGDRCNPSRATDECNGGLACTTTPADAATVRCAHCNDERMVPDTIRARVRDAALADADGQAAERLVRRLLDQRDAGVTNRRLAVAAAAGCAAIVATAAILPGYFAQAENSAAVLFLYPTVILIGVGCVARSWVANRHTAGVLVMDVTATAPSVPGDAFLCSSCSAPLPTKSERTVVVRCAYCGVASVLGIDTTSLAAAARERTTLEGTLQSHTAERRLTAFVALAGVVLAVGGTALMFGAHAAPPAPKTGKGGTAHPARGTSTP